VAALRARVQLLEEDSELCYEEIDILNEQIDKKDKEIAKWKAEAREWEDIAIAAFEEGRYDDGYKVGYEAGYDEGHECGYRNGYLQFGVENPRHFLRSSFLLAMNTRAQDVRIALIESKQRARGLAREAESEPESEAPWLSNTPEHSFEV